MVIHQFYKIPTRRKIVFFEEEPPETATAYLKGYELYRFNSSDIEGPKAIDECCCSYLSSSSQKKPNKIASDLKQYARTLLWHDCRVFARSGTRRAGFAKILRYRDAHCQERFEEKQLPASGLQEGEAVSNSEIGRKRSKY